jgi:hypothetical protein
MSKPTTALNVSFVDLRLIASLFPISYTARRNFFIDFLIYIASKAARDSKRLLAAAVI